MANENVGKVLFVDDDSETRDFLTFVAQRSGVEDFEVLEDAASAVARLEELDEAATVIFSDGLNGGWRDVVEAAKEARVPAVVVSGDPSIKRDVEAAGVVYLNKTKIDSRFVVDTLDVLLKTG